MCLMTYKFFLLLQKTVLLKIFFKSLVYSKQNAVVLKFEIVSDIKPSVTPVFTALILLLFFKLSKYINVVLSLLLIFSFFCFSYFNRKIKTHSKTIANQNIIFVNDIICY